jgi:hypothetical protein
VLQAKSDRPDGLPGSVSLSCTFASEAGTGVITEDILQSVASGTRLLPLTLLTTVVTAGDYTINAVTGIGVYNEAEDYDFYPILE